MSRNKKEELIKFHRSCIIAAAERLFLEKGIEKTTMDDISKEADYSKATIYVYFKNKDEIFNMIVYNSMKMLQDRIKKAISEKEDLFEQYFGICNELACYQDEYPLYFESSVGEINVALELEETPQVFHDIFMVGEEIKKYIGTFLLEGINQGIVRSDIQIPQTAFMFWASIAGMIRMTGQKQKFIKKTMDISKNELLQYGFETLLRSILTKHATKSYYPSTDLKNKVFL